MNLVLSSLTDIRFAKFKRRSNGDCSGGDFVGYEPKLSLHEWGPVYQSKFFRENPK